MVPDPHILPLTFYKTVNSVGNTCCSSGVYLRLTHYGHYDILIS